MTFSACYDQMVYSTMHASIYGWAEGDTAVLVCIGSESDALLSSDTVQQGEFTMVQRRFRVEILIAILAMFATLIGLSPGYAAQTPKRGGILIRTLSGDVQHADAHRISTVTSLNVHSKIHLTLLAVSEVDRKTVKGELAESYEVSPDRTVYTFKLRNDVKSHDGVPFTAEDAAYSLNRMIVRPNNLAIPRGGCIRGTVKHAEAAGPHTLKVTLKSAAASFISCVSMPYILIQPKHTIEKVDQEKRDLTSDMIQGYGPFKVKKWRRGDRYELVRNEDYYDKGLPYLDGVTNIVMKDGGTRIAAFRTGAVHMTPEFTTPNRAQMTKLQEDLGDKVTFKPIGAAGWTGFYFNLNKKPFNDVRVRRAIHLAIDRQELNELALEGVGFVATPYLWLWDWLISYEEYLTWPGLRTEKEADIKEARRLLKEAGYPDGFTATITSFTSGYQLDQAQIFIEQMKRNLGLDIKLRSLEGSSLYQYLRRHNFELATVGTGVEFNDPDAYHGTLWLPHGGRNFMKWGNDEWLQLYEKQRAIADKAERAKLLRRMARIWVEDMAFAPAIRPTINPGWWSFVKGYTQPTFHQAHYKDSRIWLDR
jgi:ABC-type transport system substrate-binding protein